jgi:hypothetical protein
MANNTAQMGEIVDLGVTLVPSATTVTSGRALSYTATVRNAGPRDSTSASVTFTMGSGLALGASLPAGCMASGLQATCTVGALAPGASRDLSVPAIATSTGSLTATAAVSSAGSAMELDGTNDSATVSITANAAPPSDGDGSDNGGSRGGGGALDVSVLLMGLLALMARMRRTMRLYG